MAYFIIGLQVAIIYLFVLQVAFVICFRIKHETRFVQQVMFSSFFYGGTLWLTTLI